jgi:hypothetical protein
MPLRYWHLLPPARVSAGSGSAGRVVGAQPPARNQSAQCQQLAESKTGNDFADWCFRGWLRHWWWPTAVIVPAAAISISIELLNKKVNLFQMMGHPFNLTRWSGTAELYYDYFLPLYMLSFRLRLRQCLTLLK